MRFAIPENSDGEDSASIHSHISDSDDYDIVGRRSTLGRNIRAGFDSSDSEIETEVALDNVLDSEDEVDLLGGGYDVVRSKSQTQTLWRPVTKRGESSKSKIKLVEVVDDDGDGYNRDWLREKEEEVIRAGQRRAEERRARMREIHMHARGKVVSAEHSRAAREEEEMRRMLEGLAIKQTRQEEEMARRFAEREKKLWADIDAAIKEVERKELEKREAELALARKKKEEEDARIAAAEKASLARRAEAERLAKEQMEKEKAARQAKEEASRREEQARLDMEERKKAADSRGQTAAEWRKWTDRQKWIKGNIVEVVKADREVKAGLRMGMRLMTRGLGQVVNTKESIVRVTTDIDKILTDQLKTTLNPTAPVLLDDNVSRPYGYLCSHLSKALIKQAESEVSAKADAAFPLARIVVGLLLRGHAAFGEILFARLVKKCPWVIPFFPSRRPDQPREEYEKSTGRGTDESLSDYVARMAGISTVYFAILQTSYTSMISSLPTPPPTPQQLTVLIPIPLRLPAAWTWLSNALRDPMPAMPPIAQLLTVFTEIAGAEVIMVYGQKQVGKAFEAILREGIDGGKVKGDSEAARQRLGLVLKDWRSLKHHSGRDWA